MRLRGRLFALLVAGLGVLGCGAGPELAPAVPPARRAAARVVPLDAQVPRDDVPTLRVEVASRPAERQRGLMGRTELAADAGMLFVYPYAAPRDYWMKGCHIPLDVAFLRADGTIVALHTLPPGAGLPDSKVAHGTSGEPALYGLEANAGWFERHRVRRGDVVDVKPAASGVAAE